MSAKARARLFEQAGAFVDLIEARHEELRFLVSPHDQNVGGRLFVRGGRSEIRTLGRALDSLRAAGAPVPPGTTFVDVGANIGTTTVPAVCRHGFARAVACEPSRDNVALLRCNAVLNGIDQRVRVLPIAVSDREEATYLRLHPRNSGAHHVRRQGYARRRSDVKVEALPLDALVHRGIVVPAEVGLLWLDVQGHEARVLAGATQITARGVPVVLELYPSMLRDDGMATIQAIADGHYTHFRDLRGPQSDEWLPSRRLPELRAMLENGTGSSFTDILLVRKRG
jgi:FkbM family methyltransferase